MQYGLKLVPLTIRDVSCTLSSFKIGVPNMLLASWNACNIKMWLHQQFFTYWNSNNILNIKKQTEQPQQTDSYDRLRWVSSLPIESPSVVTSVQYVCYLYDDNKSGSSVNDLRCWMFTKEHSSRNLLQHSPKKQIVWKHGPS